MAREYARIRISLAEDDEFEELSPAAQWLYLRVLIPSPDLSYAGVTDWRPRRLLGRAKGLTIDYILGAAAELEERRYVLFDLETEEALVRSYIRNDELLRNPKMAPAVIGAYRAVASKTLRAAIVSEIKRVHEEHPEYTSWEHKDTKDDLAQLLNRSGLDQGAYTSQITNHDAVPITNPNLGADYQSDSVQIPCHLSPNNFHPAPAPEESAPRKRGSRLTAEWMPQQETIDAIKAECPHVDLKAEHRKFVDYWTDKTGKDATKLSWEGTWRNWIRRAAESYPRGQPNGLSTVDEKVSEWMELADPKPHLKAIGND